VRHPSPPADLQPLIQVELIHGDEHEGGADDRKDDQLPPEHRKVLVLERVEKVGVPVVEPDRQADLRQLGPNDDGEKGASDPRFFDCPRTERTKVNDGLLIRSEVRGGEPPHGGDLLSRVVQHSWVSIGHADRIGRYAYSSAGCPRKIGLLPILLRAPGPRGVRRDSCIENCRGRANTR